MKLIEPFNLAGREKVEAGIYKVITRDGKPVRIVCWDKKGKEPVCALVSVGAGYEHWQLYEPNGRVYPEGYENSDDLFFTYEVPDNPQDDLFSAMMSFQEDSLDYPGNLVDIINNHRNEILTAASKVLKQKDVEEDAKDIKLSKFERLFYDFAWAKVTCKPEGETKEEYVERWAPILMDTIKKEVNIPHLKTAEGPMRVISECLVVYKGGWYVGNNIEKGMRYIPMSELVDILTKE